MTQNADCRNARMEAKRICSLSDDTKRRTGKATELDKKYPQACGLSTSAVTEFGKTPDKWKKPLAKSLNGTETAKQVTQLIANKTNEEGM